MSKKGDKTPGQPASAAPGGGNATDPLPSTTLTSDAPLFDDEWTAWIGAVLPDSSEPVDSNTTQTFLTALHDTISSGIRRKFAIISKTSVMEWINENLKSSDLAKEAKAAMDVQPRGSDLPDALMVKLLHQAVMNTRVECLEGRKAAQLAAQQAQQAEAELVTGKKKDEKTPTAPGTAAGKADTASPKSAAPKKGANGKEPAAAASRPETTAAADANPPKAKGKLRDRALPKVKVTPLDDEPVDGPDSYILLWNFSSASLLEALALESSFPLHNITTLSQTCPTSASTAMAPLSALMQDIQSRVFSAQLDSPVIFTTVCAAGAADSTAVFELLAKQWYSLLTDRREYGSFYAKQRVVQVPIVKDLTTSGNVHTSHGDAELAEIAVAIKDMVNQVAGPTFDPSAKVSERGMFKLHEPTQAVHSRADTILRLLPTARTSDPDWRLAQLASRTGLSLETAAFYLDLVQFEHILGKPDLSRYTWVEHLQTPHAAQVLETLLSSSSPSSIRYQLRGSRLLVAPSSVAPLESGTYTLPKRLGLGSWFHKKCTFDLPASLGYVYDESNPSAITVMQTPIGKSGIRKTMPTRDIVVYQLPGEAVCTLVPSTGEVVLTFAHGNTFEFRRGGSPANEVGQQPHGQYTTKHGYTCSIKGSYVHIRHAAHVDAWRCILLESGDHVVVSCPEGEQPLPQQVAYLKVNGTTGTKATTEGAQWTWTTCDGADPKMPCLHESDPVALRDIWRREDGVSAARFRDGAWLAKHVDGTVMRTRLGNNSGWGCLVPGFGEVEGGPSGRDPVVVYDLHGYRIRFGVELEIRMPTAHVVAVQQGLTRITVADSTIDLVSGSVTSSSSNESAPNSAKDIIIEDIKCGSLASSLVSGSPQVSSTITSPPLLVLQPSLVQGHASHMCLRTDAHVQHELLYAVNDQELRVHVSEEAAVSTAADAQRQQGAVAVNLVVYHLPTHNVSCRQLLRFPPLTSSQRQEVLTAWTDIQRMMGPSPTSNQVTESTHDMNSPSASAASAVTINTPLLNESDLFHRFLSTPERHLLLSRPGRAKPASAADFDNGPGFQSPTMNLADPGSIVNGPLTASRTQHLFARGSLSAVRQHLVPVRKPIPSPSQIPVRLDAALKSVKAELVPYFESAEGRAVLAELAKTRERQELQSQPRRPQSPPAMSRPLYSSGPPVDLSENLLADLDPLAELKRMHAGQVETVPNPFTRSPKLPPRQNRASSLRTSRVTGVVAEQAGKRQCFKSLGLPVGGNGGEAASQVYGRQAGTGLSATSIEGIADAAATLATATPTGSGPLVFTPPVVRATRKTQKGESQQRQTATEWRGQSEGVGKLAAPSRLDVL